MGMSILFTDKDNIQLECYLNNEGYLSLQIRFYI